MSAIQKLVFLRQPVDDRSNCQFRTTCGWILLQSEIALFWFLLVQVRGQGCSVLPRSPLTVPVRRALIPERGIPPSYNSLILSVWVLPASWWGRETGVGHFPQH